MRGEAGRSCRRASSKAGQLGQFGREMLAEDFAGAAGGKEELAAVATVPEVADSELEVGPNTAKKGIKLSQ